MMANHTQIGAAFAHDNRWWWWWCRIMRSFQTPCCCACGRFICRRDSDDNIYRMRMRMFLFCGCWVLEIGDPSTEVDWCRRKFHMRCERNQRIFRYQWQSLCWATSPDRISLHQKSFQRLGHIIDWTYGPPTNKWYSLIRHTADDAANVTPSAISVQKHWASMLATLYVCPPNHHAASSLCICCESPRRAHSSRVVQL